MAADKEAARKALNERGQQARLRGQSRGELLRAVYSPVAAQGADGVVLAQSFQRVPEQGATCAGWSATTRSGRSARTRSAASGICVLATLEHPAMLQYLDNDQNAAGHINENYARELMELHTLGVDAGYTQQDVQQLARILTGVGINRRRMRRELRPDWQAAVSCATARSSSTRRHDFGDKVLLGHPSRAADSPKSRRRVDADRAAAGVRALHLARSSRVYFVADDPPPRAGRAHGADLPAHRWRHRRGAAHHVPGAEFNAALGSKFKDPMRFVVSAVRFAYDGRPIINTRPDAELAAMRSANRRSAARRPMAIR